MSVPHSRLGWFTSLRSRVAVLAALVALLTVVSAFAFLLVASTTEPAVTRQNQRELADIAARLARDYQAHAEFLAERSSTAPPSDYAPPAMPAVAESQTQRHQVAPLDQPGAAGADDVLSAITTAALQHAGGVEGGFYAGANDRLLGYAFPTHEGPGVKRDIPPIERPLIEDVARRAAQDHQPAASVFRGPRDVILFTAVPIVVNGHTAGTTWLMKRMPGLRIERGTGFTLGVAAFATASLLCVGLAYVLARGVRRGVVRIERRLHDLEHDLDTPAATGFAGLQELGRIHAGIDRLATSLRQRILSERTLRQTLEHKERLAAVGQMAAGMAHEVRNPLATIRLRIQMIARTSGDPELQRGAAIVLEEISRLDQMVERLLSFSRPLALRMDEIDAVDLVRRSSAALSGSARRADVTIDCAGSPRPVIFRGDANRLRQVCDNVIQNAIEASSPGTVVAVTARADGDDAVIVVQDHGPGVSESAMAHVLDPFFTTKPQGTGLGLSIAYEIVRAHEGQLTIANDPAGGVEVTIRLPRAGPGDLPTAERHAAGVDA